MSVSVGQIRTWHPGATLWRRLAAGLDPRPQLVEEAAAVSPQVIRYEFAWKLRLRRSVQNSLPTSVWKLWISSLVSRRRTLGPSQAARSGDFMPRLARSGITRTGDVRRRFSERARFSGVLPNVWHHPAVRRAPPCMSSAEVTWGGRHCGADYPTRVSGLGLPFPANRTEGGRWESGRRPG